MAIDFSAIRDKLDTSIASDDDTPFPFASFLLIYTKSREHCYVEYMEGAKILLDWLGTIEYPDYAVSLAPTIPDLLRGYESDQLCKILVGNPTDLEAMDIMTKLILHTMYRDVLPELY
jgi:hypothetical protein